MGSEWVRGGRDETQRTPLQGGEGPASGGPTERRDRHVLLGISHPSGDPAQHRVFEIRAARNEAAGGWTARVGEQDRNEQLGRWDAEAGARFEERSFATPAECIGDAVATIVEAVDRDAETPR